MSRGNITFFHSPLFFRYPIISLAISSDPGEGYQAASGIGLRRFGFDGKGIFRIYSFKIPVKERDLESTKIDSLGTVTSKTAGFLIGDRVANHAASFFESVQEKLSTLLAIPSPLTPR